MGDRLMKCGRIFGQGTGLNTFIQLLQGSRHFV